MMLYLARTLLDPTICFSLAILVVAIDVEEAPCNFQSGPFHWSFAQLIPSSGAASQTRRVLYESLGLASLWLRHRFQAPSK
jgi:hypothetical protein